jgi:hypothetical protein
MLPMAMPAALHASHAPESALDPPPLGVPPCSHLACRPFPAGPAGAVELFLAPSLLLLCGPLADPHRCLDLPRDRGHRTEPEGLQGLELSSL